MNHPTRPVTAVLSRAIFAASATVFIAGCPRQAPPPHEGVTDVAMRSIAFDPPTVTITQGESVRWTNLEPALIPHTSTSGNPGEAVAGSLWDSGLMNPGQSFTHQFNEVGEFVYYCATHPNQMRDAMVIVEAADEMP